MFAEEFSHLICAKYSQKKPPTAASLHKLRFGDLILTYMNFEIALINPVWLASPFVIYY